MEKIFKKANKEFSLLISNISKNLLNDLEKIAEACVLTLKQGNKILVIGNGGSAAYGEHFVAELIGKFNKKNRLPLPAISLTSPSSVITALANDFGYEKIFLNQLMALGKENDILIILSTSGESKNLILACDYAKKNGIKTFSLLGKNGGKLKNKTNKQIIVPSFSTPRIQEIHLFLLHLLCEYIDNKF